MYTTGWAIELFLISRVRKRVESIFVKEIITILREYFVKERRMDIFARIECEMRMLMSIFL